MGPGDEVNWVMGSFCSSSVRLLFVVCLTFSLCKCRKCYSFVSRKLMRKPHSCSRALALSGRYSKAQYCCFLDVPSVQCVVWGSGRGSEHLTGLPLRSVARQVQGRDSFVSSSQPTASTLHASAGLCG